MYIFPKIFLKCEDFVRISFPEITIGEVPKNESLKFYWILFP